MFIAVFVEVAKFNQHRTQQSTTHLFERICFFIQICAVRSSCSNSTNSDQAAVFCTVNLPLLLLYVANFGVWIDSLDQAIPATTSVPYFACLPAPSLLAEATLFVVLLCAATRRNKTHRATASRYVPLARHQRFSPSWPRPMLRPPAAEVPPATRRRQIPHTDV